ncbi:MAG: hypothetical protein ACREA2_24655 [Blastocatellia bacterium]
MDQEKCGAEKSRTKFLSKILSVLRLCSYVEAKSEVTKKKSCTKILSKTLSVLRLCSYVEAKSEVTKSGTGLSLPIAIYATDRLRHVPLLAVPTTNIPMKNECHEHN